MSGVSQLKKEIDEIGQASTKILNASALHRNEMTKEIEKKTPLDEESVILEDKQLDWYRITDLKILQIDTNIVTIMKDSL